MSNEKQINNTSWKAGLDELALLPAESPFNEDASWQKLELRMAPKTGSKKIFFYWMAAASVLTCIFLFGIKLNSKKDIADPAPIVQVNIPADKKEAVQTLPVKQQEDIVVKDQNKKSSIVKNKEIPIYNLKDKEIIITKVDAAIEKNSIKEDSAAINPVAIQSLQKKPVVFPSLRKKIPVVHINELGKPIDPVEAVAGNNERPSLGSRLFSRQTFQEPDSPVSQGGNLLRIKLSPQN